MTQVTEIQNSEYSAGNGRKNTVLVALGSNLSSGFGGPVDILKGAVGELGGMGFAVKKVSPIFRSAAFPSGSGPDFANAALVASSRLSAAEILVTLGQTEERFGRSRDARWAPRTLDLDLIGVDDLVLPDVETQTQWQGLAPIEQQTQVPDQLILPHPRVQDRAFVLVPLATVAPQWQHPVLGQSVQEMLEALPLSEAQAVRLY